MSSICEVANAARIGRGITILGVGLLIGACGPGETDTREDEASEFDSPAARIGSQAPAGRVLFESDFRAGEAGGEIEGTLREVERNGIVELEVRVAGLSPGEHAWHIHAAPCGQQGPVVLALSSTREMEGRAGPVTANAQGAVERTVALPGIDRSWIGAGDHSLHIHARAGLDHGQSVACADL